MVGVCIKYMHENYGGILQAYATVSYLESHNIEYELIRYKRKKTIAETIRDIPRLFNKVWLNSRYEGIQRKINLRIHPDYARNDQIRMKAFSRFKGWAFSKFSDEYLFGMCLIITVVLISVPRINCSKLIVNKV